MYSIRLFIWRLIGSHQGTFHLYCTLTLEDPMKGPVLTVFMSDRNLYGSFIGSFRGFWWFACMILYRNLNGTPSKDPLKDPIQEFSTRVWLNVGLLQACCRSLNELQACCSHKRFSPGVASRYPIFLNIASIRSIEYTAVLSRLLRIFVLKAIDLWRKLPRIKSF